jgi:hypothetical protein
MHLFSSLDRPLPEALQDDLEALCAWDNNCYLTWVSVGSDADPDGSRWFTVKLTGDGRSFELRLEFWIPAWMGDRGLAAILPASVPVSGCRTGVSAAVDLGPRSRAELRTGLPRVARTCARLMNELWGPTRTDDVLLLTMEYQEERLPEPFAPPLEERS